MSSRGPVRARLSLVVAVAALAVPAAAQHQHTPAMSGAPQGLPHFCTNPTAISVRSGAWSSPGTWSTNRVPDAGDRVAIAAGHEVTYDAYSDARLPCVDVRGHLAFSTTANTRMKVGTMMVFEEGYLEIGSTAKPVEDGLSVEVVIADQPIDRELDPEQFGTGILALGKVTMHGAPKAVTFARLAKEALAGHRVLTFEQPVRDWKPGDVLVLPDTRQLRLAERSSTVRPRDETVRIAEVSGADVTLTWPLTYDHRGARNADGTLALLPHVGNLTRNVLLRSENAEGTRGHTLFISHADIDLRYVEFREMGRTKMGLLDNTEMAEDGSVRHFGTNQIGRYAVHFHHAFGPRKTPANGHQFTVIGSAVVSTPKWGVTVHNSHYGLVQDNVVYNSKGAGIVTEDGTESFNVFDHNFSLRVEGSDPEAPQGNYFVGLAGDPGGEGGGFWFRGQNNYIRNNVSASGDAFGYGLAAGALGTVRIPKFKGADTSKNAESEPFDTTAAPVLEFSNNEAYGLIEAGLVCNWNATISNFTVWHATRHGISGGPVDAMTVDTVRVIGDRTTLADQIEQPTGLWFQDFTSKRLVIRNVDVQGTRTGISSPFFIGSKGQQFGRRDGSMTVENASFRTQIGIVVATAYTADRVDGKPAKSVVVRGVTFEPLKAEGVVEPEAISMNYGMARGDRQPRDPVEVYDFGRKAGNDFKLYYSSDAPKDVAPCNTTRPGLGGWVCRAGGPR